MCVCMHNLKIGFRWKGESLGRSKSEAKAHDASIEGLFGLRLRGKGRIIKRERCIG